MLENKKNTELESRGALVRDGGLTDRAGGRAAVNNRGRGKRLKLILSEDGNVSRLRERARCELVIFCEEIALKRDEFVDIRDSKHEGADTKTLIEQFDKKPNKIRMNLIKTTANLIKNESILAEISISNYQVLVKQSKRNENKTITAAKELNKRTDIGVAVIVKHDRIE